SGSDRSKIVDHPRPPWLSSLRPSIHAHRTLRALLLSLLRARVTRGAQPLPVRSLPEQPLVSPVRNDVIHYCGWGVESFGLAHAAQSVLWPRQECRSCLLPLPAVSALARLALVLAPVRWVYRR